MKKSNIFTGFEFLKGYRGPSYKFCITEHSTCIFCLSKIVSLFLKRVDCTVEENQVIICGKIQSSKYFH